ncbi:MAG: L,D-transpeptidase [Bdellovibrionales bacterium]|nr:L,D-transpeptidase [Bdellovibrionales bacterium]
MRAAVVMLALFASSSFAMSPSEIDPRAEAERLEGLRQAQTLEEAIQFMTPEELEQEFDLPTDAAELPVEDLIQPANGGGWLHINVSIAKQTLVMQGSHSAPFATQVSTGSQGRGTVRGCFNPTVLSPRHRSRKYNNSPMPWAVFFYKGYALHETPYVSALGRPASHGCVRQSGPAARHVYSTVAAYRKAFGNSSVRICVK